MSISAILFFISLLGIVTMISLKAYQLRSGKNSWLAFLANKTDHRFDGVFHKVKTFISYINKRSAIALIQWIAYHILSWGRSVYIQVHQKAHTNPHSKKVLDMVSGKVEVQNGGASFYLKRLGDEGHIEKKV